MGFQRGKSDRLDAKRIAQYAYRFQDKAQRWQPDRAVSGQLKALVSIGERLIKSRDSLSKPLNEYKRFMPASYKIFKEGCKGSLQGAAKDIKALEKQIQALINAAEKIKDRDRCKYSPYSSAHSFESFFPSLRTLSPFTWRIISILVCVKGLIRR